MSERRGVLRWGGVLGWGLELGSLVGCGRGGGDGEGRQDGDNAALSVAQLFSTGTAEVVPAGDAAAQLGRT